MAPSVERRKVWLTSTTRVPCNNAVIEENARFGCKVNFARDEIPPGGKSARKNIYSVAAEETAKHRAKFGWPPVNDVAAVTKARRETL